MSIQVNDFQWIPGKNDAEYIKLLESSRNEWQKIAQKAIAKLTKLKALSKAQEPQVMTLGDLRDIGSVWELNTPPYLWMEINPSYRWTRGFWVAWREIYDMIDGLYPTYDADNYDKIWRC